MNDIDDCAAEFIDGSWTNCGCDDCEAREDLDDWDLEGGYTPGYSEAQAREMGCV
ncbi:hypothetical protein ACWGI0_00215 [Streptomyces sp. NPDC054802]